MMQKITYSGNECNNYLYFSFDTAYFETESITKELNIQPTSIMIKNEPVPKTTAWKYQINAGSEIDLEKYLENLIGILETKIDVVNQLKDKLKLTTIIQFVIDIDAVIVDRQYDNIKTNYVYSYTTQNQIIISAILIDLLLDKPASVKVFSYQYSSHTRHQQLHLKSKSRHKINNIFA